MPYNEPPGYNCENDSILNYISTYVHNYVTDFLARYTPVKSQCVSRDY